MMPSRNAFSIQAINRQNVNDLTKHKVRKYFRSFPAIFVFFVIPSKFCCKKGIVKIYTIQFSAMPCCTCDTCVMDRCFEVDVLFDYHS